LAQYRTKASGEAGPLKAYMTSSTNKSPYYIYKMETTAVGRLCTTNGQYANCEEAIESQGRRLKKTWKTKNKMARRSE
jgi:hypothetical protein